MKQVLGVVHPSKYEWHSCLTGCTGWEPLPQAEWEAHKDDCCSRCQGGRFKRVMGKLVPERVGLGAMLW